MKWTLWRSLKAQAQYVLLALIHKVYVLRAGWQTRAPLWRLLIHDWTKFAPAELPHYGRQFFGDKGDPDGWQRAWVHHQNHNPHHWDYWVNRTITKGPKGGQQAVGVLMPQWVVREMVADWMAASRAYEGRWPTLDSWPWLERQMPTLRQFMHPDSYVEALALVCSVLRYETRPRYPFWRREGEYFPYGVSFQWYRGMKTSMMRVHIQTLGRRVTLGLWYGQVWHFERRLVRENDKHHHPRR
jgi:hypothetical protein